MHLQTYRDESRSRHFDLTGGPATLGQLTWSPNGFVHPAGGLRLCRCRLVDPLKAVAKARRKICGGQSAPFRTGQRRPGLSARLWEEREMKRLTTAAIGVACLVLGAGGAAFYTHAATGPAFYSVYETNVTDEDAYKKALPDVQKIDQGSRRRLHRRWF